MQNFTVTIPIEDTQMRNRFQLRIVSDDWVVEDTLVPLSINERELKQVAKARQSNNSPDKQRTQLG